VTRAFRLDLAEMAAMTIDGLSADERLAVVLKLEEISRIYYASDPKKADVQEELERITDALKKAEALIDEFFSGWSDRSATPSFLQEWAFETTSLPALVRKTERTLALVANTPKNQKGGLLAQTLHDSKRGWAISRISELWFFCTFGIISVDSRKKSAGHDFFAAGCEAVTGVELDMQPTRKKLESATKRQRVLRRLALRNPDILPRKYMVHYAVQAMSLLQGELTRESLFWADGVIGRRFFSLVVENTEVPVGDIGAAGQVLSAHPRKGV